MRFNETDTELLLLILTTIVPNISISTIIEKLKLNEYIKGRLLNQLYGEVSKSNYKFNDYRDQELEALLKKIKFKATPR